MLDDEDLHLQRKAAIAYFRHGSRDPEVITKLKEAQQNDPELKDVVNNLLSN